MFHANYVPADVAQSACFSLINVLSNLELDCDFVGHYCEYITGGILFHRHFLQGFTTLMVVKPAIKLEFHEYTMLMEIEAY